VLEDIGKGFIDLRIRGHATLAESVEDAVQAELDGRQA
jgi:hypothetical protein